jgi:ribose 5-phosphate isomerase A
MIVGLGTGSTAKHATEAIAQELKSGQLENIRGIATSRRTAELASSLGIPLVTLDECPEVDITIDGADEVDHDGNAIKGGGGALLREKIVAVATKQYVIIIDETKLVDRLGVAFPLPVEVVDFGLRTHEAAIRVLGAEPVLRRDTEGSPFHTAAGNLIYDCLFKGGIVEPEEVQRALKRHPGIVETGLFLGMNPMVIVGRAPST